MAIRQYTAKFSRTAQKTIAVIIIALLISLLLMIPGVSKTVAKAFTKTKEEAEKLGNQIAGTAQILAFTLTGLFLVSAAGVFLPIGAPIVITLGLVVIGMGVFSLARNWKVIKEDNFDANKLLQDQVNSGVSLNAD